MTKNRETSAPKNILPMTKQPGDSRVTQLALDHITELIWQSCVDVTYAAYRAALLLQAVVDAEIVSRPAIVPTGRPRATILTEPPGMLFQFDRVPPSVNEVLNGRRDARAWISIREWWYDNIACALLALRAEGRTVSPMKRAGVLLRYHLGCKPAKDLHNYMPEKAIIDTLVQLGVLEKDDIASVPLLGYVRVVDKHSTPLVGLDLAVVDASRIEPWLCLLWSQIGEHVGEHGTAYPRGA